MKSWFIDAAEIAGTRTTSDGYLIADAKVARTGIQVYKGWELGRPAVNEIRVYRDEGAVFSKRSLGSYAHKPVTDNHPIEDVTAANWKTLSVGTIGGEIVRDGDSVRIPLLIMDAKAIDAIKNGKRELSAGYDAELDFTPGKTRDGLDYDARIDEIRVNHVAIVERGRAGSAFRIGDADGGGRSKWGAQPRNTSTGGAKVRIIIDAVPFEVDDQAAAAIGKLQDSLTDLRKKLGDSATEHTTAIAAKDTEIGTLKAQLKQAEDAKLNDADLDKRVTQRSKLIADAKAIDKTIVTDGKSDAEIRRAAVAKKFGDAMVEGMSDDVIVGMFAVAAKDAPAGEKDPIRDAFTSANSSLTFADRADNGQDAYEKRQREAWQ